MSETIVSNDKLKRLELARDLFFELLQDGDSYPPDVEKELEGDLASCKRKIGEIKCVELKGDVSESDQEEIIGPLKNYVVYLPNRSRFGTNRFLANEEEVHSEYLSDKELYDIIIYNQTVEKKIVKRKNNKNNVIFKTINLDGVPYKLLVLFIKYRGIGIPYVELYKKAWKGSRDEDERLTTPGEVKELLSTAVYELKRNLGFVEKFIIPRAIGQSYKCEGDFNFCIILSKSFEDQYILEGV